MTRKSDIYSANTNPQPASQLPTSGYHHPTPPFTTLFFPNRVPNAKRHVSIIFRNHVDWTSALPHATTPATCPRIQQHPYSFHAHLFVCNRRRRCRRRRKTCAAGPARAAATRSEASITAAVERGLRVCCSKPNAGPTKKPDHGDTHPRGSRRRRRRRHYHWTFNRGDRGRDAKGSEEQPSTQEQPPRGSCCHCNCNGIITRPCC